MENFYECLQVFKSASGAEHQVRVQGTHEQPLFCAKDICAILDLEHVGRAVAPLRDEEKVVTAEHTLGGCQNMTFITESGLYKLVFKSRKPFAQEFQHWVCSTMLPEIRKKGYYQLQCQLVEKNHECQRQIQDKERDFEQKLQEKEDLLYRAHIVNVELLSYKKLQERNEVLYYIYFDSSRTRPIQNWANKEHQNAPICA